MWRIFLVCGIPLFFGKSQMNFHPPSQHFCLIDKQIPLFYNEMLYVLAYDRAVMGLIHYKDTVDSLKNIVRYDILLPMENYIQ